MGEMPEIMGQPKYGTYRSQKIVKLNNHGGCGLIKCHQICTKCGKRLVSLDF